jgi:hypothetical protein
LEKQYGENMTLQQFWAYLKYVLRHKWFVYQAGIKLHVPFINLVVHDWDKFLPFEFLTYAKVFYKPDGSKQYVESDDFAKAWNAHQKRNKHHWQYWLLTWDRGDTVALDMPFIDILEMVADWSGAGMAINGDSNPSSWYQARLASGAIKISSKTAALVDSILGMHF